MADNEDCGCGGGGSVATTPNVDMDKLRALYDAPAHRSSGSSVSRAPGGDPDRFQRSLEAVDPATVRSRVPVPFPSTGTRMPTPISGGPEPGAVRTNGGPSTDAGSSDRVRPPELIPFSLNPWAPDDGPPIGYVGSDEDCILPCPDGPPCLPCDFFEEILIPKLGEDEWHVRDECDRSKTCGPLKNDPVIVVEKPDFISVGDFAKFSALSTDWQDIQGAISLAIKNNIGMVYIPRRIYNLTGLRPSPTRRG